MKDLGQLLIREEPFAEIVMGNTALVRGMMEASIEVVTSYPGSPTPEIAGALLKIPSDKRPFYFEFSVNEKVATEVAFGASVNGHPSCVFFKSVGLNVAADTFVQLSLLELTGGMVIILGDDPGANSSQNEQDNRHYAHMTYTPVLEPATPAQAYNMFREAVSLSRNMRMPVILRMTTHVCHAKEKVSFHAYRPRDIDTTSRFDPAAGPYIPLTSSVFPLKRKALEKLAEVARYADSDGFTEQIGNGSELGIITAGLPSLSARDALEGVENPPDLLVLGMVHPLPRKTLVRFLESHREVKVIEELDPVLEKEIKVLAYEEGIDVRIRGKENTDQWIGEYTPDKTMKVLTATWPHLFPGYKAPSSGEPAGSVPNRPAQLCPGCGHRSAFYAVKKALTKEDITVADIGCHSLGFLPPYEMGQVLLCMGHSSGTGSGLSLFNSSRKVIAFLGDSTFFHAGIPGIVNAVYNNHDLTLIIMENGTTAMTGHQDHPGTGKSVHGVSEAIAIKPLLAALGVKSIRDVDTYQQAKLTEAVKEAVKEPGFSVVIARHPCMLKFTRERRKKGIDPGARAGIDNETCEKIHECVSQFGCPSFRVHLDGSVDVNEDLCIGDGSCLQTCPVNAIHLDKGEKK